MCVFSLLYDQFYRDYAGMSSRETRLNEDLDGGGNRGVEKRTEVGRGGDLEERR